MQTGTGKCIICNHDKFAVGRISLHITSTHGDEDMDYLIDPYVHACVNCGYMQMSSSKVIGRE